MKKSVLIALVMLSSAAVFSQSQYETTTEPGGTKILKGIIPRAAITGDTSFHWYAENQKGYTPNADAVSALKAKAPQLQFIVFAGTWCGDTKYLLPKYFSLMDAGGIAQTQLTLVGVDRSKKTISHLAEALNVVNVPTVIILKEGKEVGRIVEYGKYGQPDKEVAEIVNAIK